MSIQQEKFKEIADKIRSILGTADMIAPNDFTDKIDEVMARGIDEGVNRATEQNEFNNGMRMSMLNNATRCPAPDIDESIMAATESLNEVRAVIEKHNDVVEITEDTNSLQYDTLIENIIEEETLLATTQGWSAGNAAGIEQGKQSAYDEFWDSFQQNGNLTVGTQLFAGYGWNDKTFKPKYDMKPTDANSMFMRAQITNLKAILEAQGVTINFRNCKSLYGAFQYSAITHIGEIDISDYSKYTNLNATFQECTNLVTIDNIKLIGNYAHNITDATFQNCTSLKNISFTNNIYGSINFKWSPLSKDSITNIVNHLHPTKTGFTLTLKKTAVNEAFGIDVDDATTYPEGSEYYTLRHSRNNWTFSYA